MATLNLPTTGEKPWGDKLNTAINAINAEVTETTEVIESGWLSEVNLNATYVGAFPAIAPNIYPNGPQDSTAGLQAIINAAAAIKGKVTLPPGRFIVDGLILPHYAFIEGFSGGLYRYGASATANGGTILVHKTDAANPAVTVAGGGVTIKNLMIDGNGQEQTALLIAHGFECRMDTVRVAYSGGWGIDIEGSANTDYRGIYIDNCKYGMRIQSRNSRPTNTIDFYGLTIERCAGIHLDVGPDSEGIVEALRIFGLHVEATTDSGGVQNDTYPVVRFGNHRSSMLSKPFMYGGPGPVLEYDLAASGASASGRGGLEIEGGWVLGRDVPSGYQPARLLDLVSGTEFSIHGTRIGSYSSEAIRIRSTFGAQFRYGNLLGQTTNVVSDQRTTKDPSSDHWGNSRIRGEVRIDDHLTASGTAPAIAASQSGVAVSLSGNDTRGVAFFGSAATPASGAQASVTFSRTYTAEPVVVITPGNSAAAALDAFVATNSAGFTIHARNAPAAPSLPATAHQFKFVVIG